MAYDLDGPEFPEGCAIIFGGSGGIGQAIAGLLASRGVNVVVTYRQGKDKLSDLVRNVEAMGRKITLVQCDTADRASVDRAFAEARPLGRVHTVVSATGLLFDVGPLADFPAEDFRNVIETDVIGFFNIAQASIKAMRETGGGSITAVTTTAVGKLMPTDALSSVPKAGVSMMVRHIAAEEGPNGIRANAVGPGLINTGITLTMRVGPAKYLFDQAADYTPLRRDGEAHEVAQVVAFLASARASFVSGQLVYCDGGLAA